MKTLKFKENLKTALILNKLTQQEFANKLGTTQATINRWLNGINEPNLEMLIKICICLNETPNTLLGFED